MSLMYTRQAMTMSKASHQKLKEPERNLLIVICDIADDEGYCWPGYDLLAARRWKSRRAIQNSVSKLIGLGYIDRAPVRPGLPESVRAYRVSYESMSNLRPAGGAKTTGADGGFHRVDERPSSSGGKTFIESMKDLHRVDEGLTPPDGTQVTESTGESGQKTPSEAAGSSMKQQLSKNKNYHMEKSDFVDQVWSYYAELYPKKKRRAQNDAVIATAQEAGYDLEECKMAILGLFTSSWHNGENPGRKDYNTIDYALKVQKLNAPSPIERMIDQGRKVSSDPEHAIYIAARMRGASHSEAKKVCEFEKLKTMTGSAF